MPPAACEVFALVVEHAHALLLDMQGVLRAGDFYIDELAMQSRDAEQPPAEAAAEEHGTAPAEPAPEPAPVVLPPPQPTLLSKVWASYTQLYFTSWQRRRLASYEGHSCFAWRRGKTAV
jgi:hypothetical protein